MHRWALDIVVREYEFYRGRWVPIPYRSRLVTADPDKRWRGGAGA